MHNCTHSHSLIVGEPAWAHFQCNAGSQAARQPTSIVPCMPKRTIVLSLFHAYQQKQSECVCVDWCCAQTAKSNTTKTELAKTARNTQTNATQRKLKWSCAVGLCFANIAVFIDFGFWSQYLAYNLCSGSQQACMHVFVHTERNSNKMKKIKFIAIKTEMACLRWQREDNNRSETREERKNMLEDLEKHTRRKVLMTTTTTASAATATAVITFSNKIACARLCVFGLWK